MRKNAFKPRVLRDIRLPESGGSFDFLDSRVNLHYRKVFIIPLLSIGKACLILVAAVSLIFGSVSAPTFPRAEATVADAEERKALETQLEELEKQIDQYESQVTTYQKQGKTLKGQISTLNSKIEKLNLQIKAINLTLSQLDKKIGQTEEQIGVTENNIQVSKRALGQLLQDIHESDQASLMEIFLLKPRLSDFFNDLNNITLLQGNLRVSLNEIVNLHEQLTEQKTQLSIARADASTLKDYQASQKQETEKVKQEKNTLLTTTKGQESRYQVLLQETRKNAAQIRNRLFELLGGGQLTFEQAYEYAKLASGATGVRPAFILAILDRESALGQNVGRCKYNEVFSATGKPAMHPERDTPIFLEITRELGINPESVTVSCPNRDGTYGGAMGPAQFIPSTWKIYKDQIAKVTGRSPASPWNNADAFVAAALYLKDSGAAQEEKAAAAKYYCGSRWRTSYVCLNVYGRKVIEQAQRFEEDIRTITS